MMIFYYHVLVDFQCCLGQRVAAAVHRDAAVERSLRVRQRLRRSSSCQQSRAQQGVSSGLHSCHDDRLNDRTCHFRCTFWRLLFICENIVLQHLFCDTTRIWNTLQPFARDYTSHSRVSVRHLKTHWFQSAFTTQ